MRKTLLSATALTLIVAASCANGQATNGQPDGSTTGDSGVIDGASGECSSSTCDDDNDGVPDTIDQCPHTLAKAVVNKVGCADSQLTAKLEPTFPSYGLTWTPTGELGRAGGLTWTYTGIQRGDLFHIYWIVCDDPATPCGLSLDGPIDAPGEHWVVSTPAFGSAERQARLHEHDRHLARGLEHAAAERATHGHHRRPEQRADPVRRRGHARRHRARRTSTAPRSKARATK